MKLLHIYPQAFEHQEARIVGNQEGLVALKSAIDEALLEGKYATPETPDPMFANDGEGYSVIVERLPADWHDPRWQAEKPYYQATEMMKEREPLTAALNELLDAMRRYEMDTDEEKPYEHRAMMKRAKEALNGGKS